MQPGAREIFLKWLIINAQTSGRCHQEINTMRLAATAFRLLERVLRVGNRETTFAAAKIGKNVFWGAALRSAETITE